MIPPTAVATIAILGLSPEQAAGVAEAMSEVERATAAAVAEPLEKKLGIKRARDAATKRRERSGLMARLEAVETAAGLAVPTEAFDHHQRFNRSDQAA